MRKENERFIDKTNQTQSYKNRLTNRRQTGRKSRSAAPLNKFGKIFGFFAGIALAAIIALSFLDDHPVEAQNLGSPPFANPSEVGRRAGENRLRMVMQLVSGEYTIPNVGKFNMRQFRGWDAAEQEPADIHKGSVAPGPTLRARLGDKVEITYLNKIDDAKFPYTFVTDSKPGFSDFGCDQAGLRSATTGLFNPYPQNDKFPNCFHGSSTANIHFHGTHTSPDGLGDNVLLQLLPQVNQTDWTNTFNNIFNSGKIPQKWADMPAEYRDQQMEMIKQHDADAADAARKNNLPPPDSLYEANQMMIHEGQWPQYLIGAFPNFFDIPDYNSGKWKAGQAPGTHWYHAHKHGSTSLHILNGLAGALIIESSQTGGYDHTIRDFYGWKDSYGEHEKIIVFQQFDTTQNLQRSGPGGKGIKQVLVNGKLTPTITMAPGEVQLWRLINATEGNNAGKLTNDLFTSADFLFKQTAQDGVQFSPGNYNNQPFLNTRAPGGQVPGGLALAAGNRADVLVKSPTKPGIYTFVTGVTTKNPTGTTMFFVNVTGTSVDAAYTPSFPAKWPDQPKFLNDLPKPGPYDVTNPGSPVKFQWEAGRTGIGLNNDGFAPHFMINNKQFGETGEIIDQCMPLDGLQDWILENRTTTPHPFHIHINPFQVLKIETPTAQNQYSTFEPKSNYVWQDVITIPPGIINTDGSITPGRITIRQTYLDFTGTFVLHCHILAHEDRGMMQLVRVVPANMYPKGCQFSVPAHH